VVGGWEEVVCLYGMTGQDATLALCGDAEVKLCDRLRALRGLRPK
jgi:hypothetical protein